MAKDIDLMTKNAKIYNEPGSQVFKVTSFYSFHLLYDISSQIVTTVLFLYRMLTP